MSIPLTETESERLLEFFRVEIHGGALAVYDLPPTVLPGGFDNRVFRLRLQNCPLSNDLVIRLYQPSPDTKERANMESVVQNSLLDSGYPAPRVYVTCLDPLILGSPFILMDFVQGDQLLSIGEPRASEIMGEIHAQLHRVNPGPLVEALQSRALPSYRLHDRFSMVDRIIGNHPWLQEPFDWLMSEVPEEQSVSICHGDFHKLNVLVDAGQVTGVVDWSNVALMEPAFDVASTTISFSVISKHLVDAGLFEVADLEQVVEVYQSAYETTRPLDRTNWDYYWVLRSFLILLFADRGAAVFRHPGMLAELAQGVRRLSGVQVTPPHY